VQGSPCSHHASIAMNIDLLLPYLFLGLVFGVLLLLMFAIR
jgi:hypothetical protein